IAEGRERNNSSGSVGNSGMSSSSTSGGTNLAEQNRVRIEAHESTNSVVIYGPAELSRELSSIIRQLDIRRAQ
ncbi:MAG TPA: hypothetical protein DEP32_05050, partial [Pseudomonas sp.]|nr:hypothetical protein [Pseudomonas sp.]